MTLLNQAVFRTTAETAAASRRRPDPVWPERLSTIDSPIRGIRLPDDATLDQDAEWCDADLVDGTRRVRFHSYAEIYRISGMYERLFYDKLGCCSPSRVVSLLDEVVAEAGESLDGKKVLDVGAGNGMVGDELRARGAASIVGVDIIPEAKDAALRDRPGVYDDYRVVDLTDLREPDEEAVRHNRLDVLTTVAALGYGDIPSAAFVKALDLVETPAWVAFNIRDKFLTDTDQTGFAGLIQKLMCDGVLQMEAYRRYAHRRNVAGQSLHYVAMVARKLKDVPDDLLAKA